MRKQDIRAGVPYAYSYGQAHRPEPCVLVTTELRTGRQSGVPGPWSRPALPAAPPGGGRYGSARTGYAALFREYGWEHRRDRLPDADVIARMLAVSPGCLETGEVPDGLRLMIITSLRPLLGPWDEAIAKLAAREAEEERQQAARDAVLAASAARLEAVTARLAAHGVTGLHYFGGDSITVPVEEAEKIANLLEGGTS